MVYKNPTRPVLRYAVGSTLIMAIAFGNGWPLAFIIPVLSLGFLAPGKKAPTLKGGLSFIFIIIIAVFLGVMIGRQIDRPYVMVPVIGLLLLNIFYSTHPFMNPMTKIWMIIALLMLPMMNLMYPDLATDVALVLIFGATVTILMVWVVFGLFPDKEPPKLPTNAPLPPPPLTPRERYNRALLSTLVILPVFVLFYAFQLAGSILILIFIGILSMEPSFAKNFQAGKALIIGNVLGGIVSILAYNLLVIAPHFSFLILVVLSGGLFLGTMFFSDRKAAPLFNMAFSTFLLVIGSTTGESASIDAGEKMLSRLLQMFAAVAYVVIVFGVIEKWKESSKHAKPQTS